MSLSAGSRLGSYEVLSRIGAGGMGEVYKARDTKLGREVAIKVLPEEFFQLPERISRFEREARLLAALNHPGIAVLYGFEEHEGTPFLIMELVEGETLAEQIARGPIPADEVLPLFEQISDALETAHEKGIVHRDLKPANIKITPEGRVKILDFGLAKAFEPETPAADSSQSPTLTKGTALGAIMGTASYMSPEQARGKTVDKRSDIWAFGCCLYEALTGKKAFDGDSVTDVLAAVVRANPDWSALPERVPQNIRKVLRRCLQKERSRRLRDIGDARLEMEDAESSGGVLSVRPSISIGRVALIFLASLALGVLVASAVWWGIGGRDDTPSSMMRRLAINFPASARLFTGRDFTMSRDGRRIAYVGLTEQRTRKLFVREIEGLEPREIAGTDGAQRPAFSPGGDEVAYHAPGPGSGALGKLMSVRLDGGMPIEICPSGFTWWAGVAWGPGDTVVFSEASGGLFRVAARGGEPEQLTAVDSGKGERYHLEPRFLPDGKSVLFTVSLETGDQHSEVLLLETKERLPLEGVGPYARYLPSGHMIYPKGETVEAVPYDLEGRKTMGRARTLDLEMESEMDAWRPEGPLHFDWAREGTLVYAPPGVAENDDSIVWVDRQGREEPLEITLDEAENPRLSPDGRRFSISNEKREVWVYDMEGESPPVRLTFGGDHRWPIWSPDGRRLAFTQFVAGAVNLAWTSADATDIEPEVLVSIERDQIAGTVFPSSWTPDGRALLFFTGRSVWVLSLESKSIRRLFDSPFVEQSPAVSPDGGLIAYASNRSGQMEVWISPYPDVSAKPPLQVSRRGGAKSVWSRNGRELFYLESNRMMAVAIRRRPELSVGEPRPLFEPPPFVEVGPGPGPGHYDVAPDGRFLMLREAEGADVQTRLVVVENWLDELKRLVPPDN